MKRISTTPTVLPGTDMGAVGKAWDEVSASFDRFCLAAGVDALGAMMEKDVEEACGARHARSEERRGHRWGRTQGKIGFHAGKVAIERPRVRDLAGQELALPSWDRAVEEDWLGKWAMNLMLINVSTRKFRRAVRLPEGDVPALAGAGVSKSAASRHFVALSAARMKEWMGADLSGLDIMVVQIDGIHISEHLVLVAALGIDSEGFKHPLGLMEGATEHSAVVQALIDDLIERGLDPAVPRLFIIDGSKALAKAIRRSFGRHTPIQRCQIHKARNIMERLSPALHASVRRALRQAWELDNAARAEKLIRNLAHRLERDAPGVSKSILEGLDEILTVSRLGLPAELRRSLACTNIIENMMGTLRRVTRNVKRWSSPSMALRWTAAAMHEAMKGFRRLKAFKQLPALRAALAAHYEKETNTRAVAQNAKAA
jgi:putative transposase